MNMRTNKIENKRSFAEEHPKWNQAIGTIAALTLVVLAIFIVVKVIQYAI